MEAGWAKNIGKKKTWIWRQVNTRFMSNPICYTWTKIKFIPDMKIPWAQMDGEVLALCKPTGSVIGIPI